MSIGIINTNHTAVFSLRIMDKNSTNLGKSLEKLSSGMRINRASDDSAGLAISEKMRAQLRGIDQARRNTQDATSMIQTAEGVMDTMQGLVHRMRTLAVQASTDNYTTHDRQQIQKEMDKLISELDRIAVQTEFNTKKLLDGSATGRINSSNTKVATADISGAVINADYSITVIDAGSACRIHGNANVSDVSQASGGDSDTVANLRDLGISGNCELHLVSDNITRVLSLNEDMSLKDVVYTINRSGAGITAGLDAEGNDITLTSMRSGSRFNISFGSDPDGVALKLGFTGGASTEFTSSHTASDAAGNNTGIPVFTSGTDTIIEIQNITRQNIFATLPGYDPAASGIHLGFFRSDSRTFSSEELSNPINDIMNGLGLTAPQSVDLTQSNLLKGLTFHIDEDIDRGIMQQRGNATTAGFHTNDQGWTSDNIFDRGNPDAGGTNSDWDPAPAVPGNLEIEPVAGPVAAAAEAAMVNNWASQGAGVYSGDKNTTVRVSVRDARQTYHIGANESQTMNAEFFNMTAEALGLSTSMRSGGKIRNGLSNTTDLRMNISVETQKSAETALGQLDRALNYISTARTKLGAVQNSLAQSYEYLQLSYETGPESIIRDTDMAKEMVEKTRLDIINASGMAMLAQANAKPQRIVDLISGL